MSKNQDTLRKLNETQMKVEWIALTFLAGVVAVTAGMGAAAYFGAMPTTVAIFVAYSALIISVSTGLTLLVNRLAIKHRRLKIELAECREQLNASNSTQ